MFSTPEIVRCTNAKSYERGKALAEKAESVTGRSFTSGKSSCDISAEVRSSSSITDRFISSIATDAAISRIEEYECSCPAARKYSFMCKHCVALALTFKSDPASFAGFSDHDSHTTSHSIKRFLERQAPSDAPMVKGDAAHIDVELEHRYGEWHARFAVRVADMRYVLSDIDAFAKAIAKRRVFTYGKRLSFVHSPEAFDAESRPIAVFLAETISSDSSASTARRELSLDEGEVAALLDAVGGSPFDVEDDLAGLKARSIVVQDSPEKLILRIIADGEDGYSIIRDERLDIACGADSSYVFTDEAVFRFAGEYAQAAVFLHDVYLSSDEELFISKDDAPLFFKNVVPMLEGAFDISYPEELDALRPRKCTLSFYFDCIDTPDGDCISLACKVSYGAADIDLLAPATGARPGDANADDANGDAPRIVKVEEADEEVQPTYRDEEAEGRAIGLTGEYFDSSMLIPLDDVDLAGELLYDGLARFQELGDVYTTPEFDRLINDRSVRTQIGLSIAGNLINMDIAPEDISRMELAQLLSAYQRRRRFHRLKNGKIASLADMDLAQLDRMVQDLGIKASDLRKDTVQIPAYSAFFLDRECPGAHRDESFESYIRRFEDGKSMKAKLPKGLTGELRPYQVEGYRWLRKLVGIEFGGILADEMGLGKSIQMIAFILSLKEDGALDTPALIVCPASLVYNWMEEFRKFAPDISVCPIDGTRMERSRKRRMRKPDVFIASYDTVRMDAEAFEEQRHSVIVLDEAQFIKNHATKTTRAVKRLHGVHRFALTGTPIENRLSEIWSIFDFLMPGFLGTYAQFRTRFEADILGGDEDVARRLRALIGPFVLRRLKDEVLRDLPEKQETIVRVALTGEQRKLYDANEQKLCSDLLEQRRKSNSQRGNANRSGSRGIKVDVLAELMRLRQIALEPSLVYSNYDEGSAKTEAIMELIAEARDSGRKALVFSQFTSYLDVLKERLYEEGLSFYEITGQTPKKTRVELANAFNEDDVPIFLVSLKAGGTGLNLIGASVVIHSDPWWNAAAVNQATDRAHRIGQSEMVSVYKVIAKDSIEERILDLQRSKAELAGSVISETDLTQLSSLTADELESLLFG